MIKWTARNWSKDTGVARSTIVRARVDSTHIIIIAHNRSNHTFSSLARLRKARIGLWALVGSENTLVGARWSSILAGIIGAWIIIIANNRMSIAESSADIASLR